MSDEERDAFLAAETMCRLATIGGDGAPHSSALWFVWDGTHIWLNSIVKSQRWTNAVRDDRVSVIVDGGESFGELQGVTISGRAEPVGEAPRTDSPNDVLAPIELAFARKYMGRDEFVYDGGHAWLRVTPTKIASWDFRKYGLPKET